jgi:hypothetical protein
MYISTASVCVCVWNGIKVKHNKRYRLCGAYNKGYSYLISEVTAGTDKLLLSINEFNFRMCPYCNSPCGKINTFSIPETYFIATKKLLSGKQMQSTYKLTFLHQNLAFKF